jgi:hypothetical protein
MVCSASWTAFIDTAVCEIDTLFLFVAAGDLIDGIIAYCKKRVTKESNSIQNGKKFSRKDAKDAKKIFKSWF